MMTCKDVSRAVASDELSTMSWSRRVAMRMHLLMCRHCRRYAQQMRAIGEAARRLFRDPLEPEAHARLRESVIERTLGTGDASTE